MTRRHPGDRDEPFVPEYQGHMTSEPGRDTRFLEQIFQSSVRPVRSSTADMTDMAEANLKLDHLRCLG